jgi:hypothetical protein
MGACEVGHEDGAKEAHPVLEELVDLVVEDLPNPAQVLMILIAKLDGLLEFLKILKRNRRSGDLCGAVGIA